MQSKIMVLAMILVLFVSQTFAYDAMSCQMMNSEQSNHSMMMNDHVMPMGSHSMDMSQMNMDSKNKMDCCGEECSCPPGTCANYALSHINLSASQPAPASNAATYHFSLTEIDPIQHQRPPISA